ncbi:MAG: MFS transporter [Methanomassiliicoccaceae archaeon]|nr:MFS transporter [Methanomassiliicoccaceae archaeon]
MSDDEGGFTSKEKRIVLIACCIAGFISPLLTTMINVAVPNIIGDFDLSEHSGGWPIMAFFLSSVAFLVPMSRLSDLYGKRKMFIFGIIVVLISSLFSALSVSFEMLLVCRVVAGIGTASISSTSISMIAQVYPRSQRGLPLAINTMCIYIGASLGPAVGGLFTDMFGWRSMFLALIPFSVAGLVSMLFFKTDFRTSEGEPFDLKGSLLYGVGIVAMMYGVISLPELFSPVFMAAGAVLLVAFFNFETKERYPVLAVNLFSGRKFRRSTIATLLNYGSSYAVLFSLSLYLRDVGGMKASTVGLIILLQPAIQATVTPFAGRMSDKIDPRYLTTAGMMMMCVGTALMITLTVEVVMFKVYLTLIFTGLGYALFSSPNTNMIMGSVGAKHYSESSGVISVMRQVGMMTSVAVVMCMISIILGTSDAVAGHPELFEPLVSSIRYSFVVCFILAVAGALMTWFSKDNAGTEGSVP